MSKYLTLNVRDAIRGLIVAIIYAVLSGAYEIIATKVLPTAAQWQTIGITALGVGIAYAIKNFFTNSSDQMLTKEAPK